MLSRWSRTALKSYRKPWWVEGSPEIERSGVWSGALGERVAFAAEAWTCEFAGIRHHLWPGQRSHYAQESCSEVPEGFRTAGYLTSYAASFRSNHSGLVSLPGRRLVEVGQNLANLVDKCCRTARQCQPQRRPRTGHDRRVIAVGSSTSAKPANHSHPPMPSLPTHHRPQPRPTNHYGDRPR